MTTKVNGAVYPGVWVERKVAFVKIIFPTDITTLNANNLTELGTTTPVSTGTVGTSTFGIVESYLVGALKILETRATVLAISAYNATTFSVDVMLGNAEGWFAPLADGVIGTNYVVSNTEAVITVAGSAPADSVGTLVTVVPGYVSFSFSYMDGNMAIATLANGALVSGPGSTSGAFPTNSPTGTPGFYPV